MLFANILLHSRYFVVQDVLNALTASMGSHAAKVDPGKASAAVPMTPTLSTPGTRGIRLVRSVHPGVMAAMRHFLQRVK